MGIYGKGMHGFILDEMELGLRVARFLDEEEAEGTEWVLFWLVGPGKDAP